MKTYVGNHSEIIPIIDKRTVWRKIADGFVSTIVLIIWMPAMMRGAYEALRDRNKP